jgi:hypothetical protein
MFLHRLLQNGRIGFDSPYTLSPPQVGQRTIFPQVSFMVRCKFSRFHLKSKGSVQKGHPQYWHEDGHRPRGALVESIP